MSIVSHEQFLGILCESLGLHRSDINDNTSFLDDLGIDSLSVSNLLIKLEYAYNIRFELSNVWELNTVGEAYRLFSRALESRE